MKRFVKYVVMLVVVLIMMATTGELLAQNRSKSVAEQKRRVEQYKRDLERAKREVSELKKEKGSATEQVDRLTKQMNLRASFIAETERKQELLKAEADDLTRDVDSLSKELEHNKQIYAEAVRVAYRNYRTENTTTYLFSATNLSEATHRMANIRHIAEQRAMLADKIIEEQRRLTTMRDELNTRHQELDSVGRSLEAERSELQRDREEAKRNYEKLSAQEKAAIKEQKRQQKLLEKATQELRKLTEGNRVGKSFSASTKALNLPVEGGKAEKMQINMVKILGKKGDAVNSIYEGKVIRIVVDNTNHSTVMIAHGSYVSVYTHLSQIRVAQNDVVKRNQQIGTIGIGVDHNGTMSAYMQFMIINTESNKQMNVMDCFKK